MEVMKTVGGAPVARAPAPIAPVDPAVVPDARPDAEEVGTPVLDEVLPEESRPEARNIALIVLALIAFIFALRLAKDFFVPLIFGILISYSLRPVISWLERRRVPRIVGVSLVMAALVGSAAIVAASVYNEAESIVDELPFATYKFTSALKQANEGQSGMLDKLRSVADELKKVASPAEVQKAGQSGAAAAPMVVKPPNFELNDLLWAGSLGAAAFLGKLTMVLFLVFFALLSGDTFKRKLVKLTGPSLSNKKITVHILDDINSSIQAYMLMLLVTNVLLALLTWVALRWMGLENAGAWAAAAGLLHVIPYFGSGIAAAVTGFAAFLQFESFPMMLAAAAVVILIATVVGTLVTTWMTGRIAKMNATAVFVALLFGGWLWGVAGMLLCVPVVVVVKVVSQHVEGLQSLSELLGE